MHRIVFLLALGGCTCSSPEAAVDLPEGDVTIVGPVIEPATPTEPVVADEETPVAEPVVVEPATEPATDPTETPTITAAP